MAPGNLLTLRYRVLAATLGAFLGRRSNDLRVMLNYEILKDDLGKHDDKFYLRPQIRF